MLLPETKLMLAGPAGDIEAIITQPNEIQAATAIICHPHPLFGGTMNNKVVTTLAKSFNDKGFQTIRFNFRGVGKSAGTHDEGRGETTDVKAIAAWVQNQWPGESLSLAGFSFGGFVAASAAAQIPTVQQLITVAPQVSRFLEAKLPPIQCPWTIIQGEEDDVISPQAVYEWVDTLVPKPTLIRLPAAGHFFHGKLMELRGILEQVIKF